MNQNYNEMPNGYLESINKGIQTVRAFSGHMTCGKGTQEERIQRLIEELRNADAIVIGAGAALLRHTRSSWNAIETNAPFTWSSA